MEKPEYTHDYTVGEETEWDDLPRDVIPISENETHVKIALIDEVPTDTVHVEKKALREKEWESVEDFRDDVDWGIYDEE